jgi:predicted enzyme related to lactoylglutathione lyase
MVKARRITMHRSRFCALVIDSEVDVEKSAKFWAAAFGKELDKADPEFPTYRTILTADDEPIILVQKVDHAPRVHLDIEADDKEAEVARLEALGAKKIAFVKRWYVMEAPSGHRFCVVNPQRGPLGDKANQWK